MQIIKKAWIEPDGVVSKLCVRYHPDTGVENFGNFFPKHRIVPEEFEGLSITEACRKFKNIVYPSAEVSGPDAKVGFDGCHKIQEETS